MATPTSKVLARARAPGLQCGMNDARRRTRPDQGGAQRLASHTGAHQSATWVPRELGTVPLGLSKVTGLLGLELAQGRRGCGRVGKPGLGWARAGLGKGPQVLPSARCCIHHATIHAPLQQVQVSESHGA